MPPASFPAVGVSDMGPDQNVPKDAVCFSSGHCPFNVVPAAPRSMECLGPGGRPSPVCDQRRLASVSRADHASTVRALLSLAALIAGLLLVYMGYERQHSL